MPVAAQASTDQPIRKHRPPIGVIAPVQRGAPYAALVSSAADGAITRVG